MCTTNVISGCYKFTLGFAFLWHPYHILPCAVLIHAFILYSLFYYGHYKYKNLSWSSVSSLSLWAMVRPATDPCRLSGTRTRSHANPQHMHKHLLPELQDLRDIPVVQQKPQVALIELLWGEVAQFHKKQIRVLKGTSPRPSPEVGNMLKSSQTPSIMRLISDKRPVTRWEF